MTDFKQEIEKVVDKRKKLYKENPDDMESRFNGEKESAKEYNGRQLLELLQNADDEKSTCVSIELDTEKSTLKISNGGTDCTPFSIEGIKSLMIPNRSPKKGEKYIGNKGLGFRSLVTWSEEIGIITNGVKITFSRDIADCIYKSMFSKEQRQQHKTGLAFFAIPEIEEYKDVHSNFTTSIIIKYIKEYEQNIQGQLNELVPELMLFLNHIDTIKIDIDNDDIIKEHKKAKLQRWNVREKEGTFPKDILGENDEQTKYQVKIAFSDDMKNNEKRLFSYFPTRVGIAMPFIVHGTFDLNSSRNDLNDSKKNKWVLSKLAKLIVKTAEEIAQKDIPTHALRMFQYDGSPGILENLGFYKKLERYKRHLRIFPCTDGKFRKLKDTIYNQQLSAFVVKTNNKDLFPNLLIPDGEMESLIKAFRGCSPLAYKDFNTDDMNALSKRIENIDHRAELIHILHSNEIKDISIFLDSHKKIINYDTDIFTPASKDASIELPNYINITFMHQDLFDALIKQFNIADSDKARNLQCQLKDIGKVHSYEPRPVIEKIISQTKNELENAPDKASIIKQMVQCLYKNYNLFESTQIERSVPLLNEKGEVQNAEYLYLPNANTQLIFDGVFTAEQYLKSHKYFELETEKNISYTHIEGFFMWLGVNKFPKMEKDPNDSAYVKKCLQNIPEYNGCYSTDSETVQKLEKIINNIKVQDKGLEKILLWFLLHKDLNKLILSAQTIWYSKDKQYANGNSEVKYSYIAWQMQQTSIFKDYLIDGKGYNDFQIDYEYIIEKTNTSERDIDNILLKIGAVEHFHELSIERVRQLLQERSEKEIIQGIQTLYEKCVRHYSKNRTALQDANIDLLAKKDDQLAYFDPQEVYYSDRKLPKYILKNHAIIYLPKRVGKNQVCAFFGIQEPLFSMTVNKVEEHKSITKQFYEKFKQLTPYILAYRCQNIDSDTEYENQLKKLKNIRIKLCSVIEISDGDDLENYDYITDRDTHYIKVNADASWQGICSEYEFQTAFADILGLAFDVESVEYVGDMLDKEEAYIKKKTIHELGDEALKKAHKALGKDSEMIIFWRCIYNISNKSHSHIFDDKKQADIDIANRIKWDLGLDSDIENISYENLSNDTDKVITLSKKLQISPDELNGKLPNDNKLNFKQYHVEQLQQKFGTQKENVVRKIYQYCEDHDQKQQFIEKCTYYKEANYREYIQDKSKNNKDTFTIDYDNIVEQYINKHFDYIQGVQPTQTDWREIVKNNKQRYPNNLENEDLNSLLCFKNVDDKIRSIINQCSSDDKTDVMDDLGTVTDNDIIPDIIDTELTKPEFSIDNTTKTKTGGRRHSQRQQQERKKRGDRAEQIALQSLKQQYDEDNVRHISKDDDSAGYDIEYYNGENWKKVEVKVLSNGEFFISKNQYKFAKEYQKNYEIFLVDIDNNKCYRISKNAFQHIENNKKPNEFKVIYELLHIS